MIRIIGFLLILIISTSSLIAQNQGIQFSDKSWEEILKQAKEEDKLIFVDMYADWCVPCKVMEDEIFTYDEVGYKYNESFINARRDVDQLEGSMLSLRYGVSSLPGLLFLTPDETLVYKINGYQGINELLVEHDKAINPNLKLEAWNKRYNEGDRNSAFLYSYATFSESVQGPLTEQLYSDYLIAEHDWLTPQSSAIVLRNANEVYDSTFIFILNNSQYYKDQFSDEVIQERIYDKVDLYGTELIKVANFSELQNLFALAYGDNGIVKAEEAELKYAMESGDIDRAASVFASYYLQANNDIKLIGTTKDFMKLNANTDTELESIENAYLKILSQSPDEPTIMNSLAENYMKMGRWSDAVSFSKQSYKKAKSLKMDDWRNYKKSYKSIKKLAKKAK